MHKFLSPGYSLDKGVLLPQEEMLEVGNKQQKIAIGVLKEDFNKESRIPLTPEAVEILVENGHEVMIERDAGSGANYRNTHYSEMGGQILDKKEDIFNADVILKVSPFTIEEIDLFKSNNQLAFSSIQLINQNRGYFQKLMSKKVTAISYEFLKDGSGTLAIERSMNSISGYTAILVAAEYLSNTYKGKGVMLGGITGITPADVIILGAGTTAEYAIRGALGLGAHVKVFDNSLYRLRNLQDKIGTPLYTSIFHPKIIHKAIKSADVIIGAIPSEENMNGFLITEEMVKEMKEGSVIVDTTINQGGCIETSEPCPLSKPVYIKYGVLHHCVPNLPSRVARTASIALSNVFTPLLLNIGSSGGFSKHIKHDTGLRSGIYVYNGILTNSRIGDLYSLPYQNIDLFITAF